MEVSAVPPLLAENSLVPMELEDRSTVPPVVTGAPAAVRNCTVRGPIDGLAVAVPLIGVEVMASSSPPLVLAGPPVAGPPGRWAGPGGDRLPGTRSRSRPRSARPGRRRTAAATMSKTVALAGARSAGVTELDAVSV